MNMIAFTMKLERGQSKLLEAISHKTHVPKSRLVREGIEFVIQKYREEVISPELRRLLDRDIREDLGLLHRLSKA